MLTGIGSPFLGEGGFVISGGFRRSITEGRWSAERKVAEQSTGRDAGLV